MKKLTWILFLALLSPASLAGPEEKETNQASIVIGGEAIFEEGRLDHIFETFSRQLKLFVIVGRAREQRAKAVEAELERRGREDVEVAIGHAGQPSKNVQEIPWYGLIIDSDRMIFNPEPLPDSGTMAMVRQIEANPSVMIHVLQPTQEVDTLYTYLQDKELHATGSDYFYTRPRLHLMSKVNEVRYWSPASPSCKGDL